MISHKECQTLGFAHSKFTDRQIFPHTDACSKEKKIALLPVIWKLTCLVGKSYYLW